MLSKIVAKLIADMYKVLFLITLSLIISCNTEVKPKENHDHKNIESPEIVDKDSLDTIKVISNYDLDGVDPNMRAEFKQTLANIEKEHGLQWDFCSCVIKNDSINKAFQEPNLPDKDFDRLFERSNVIEQRCQAFLAQNPNQTPDDRAKHEKNVRDCLKGAGLK